MRGCAQRRSNGIFPRISCKSNIPFGHSFQRAGQKKYELQISVWEAQNRLAGCNNKWYFTGPPIRHTVMSWIFRSEAIFLWMPANTESLNRAFWILNPNVSRERERERKFSANKQV